MSIEDKLMEMIDDRIGRSTPVGISPIKGLKIQFPDPYRGQNSLEVFEIWLGDLLRWMHLNQMNGLDRDEDRVVVLGMALREEASKWFFREVESPTHARRQWNFKDVIIALYTHCVHKTTAQDVMDEFNNTRYSRKGGVATYYNDLQHRALRLVEPPNDYTFRKLFMSGLPEDISKNLLKTRAISAEHATIEEILGTALEVEHVEAQQRVE
ncbi:hypothetical protein BC834DRAFT_974912 [Gloeopeniophorella convolvens]|nr:hypothetical protein BC834DRAFT_974912 [Gloeopeniophorella convolvens]